MHLHAVVQVLNTHFHELETQLDKQTGQNLIRLITQMRDAGDDRKAQIKLTKELATLCGENEVLHRLLSPGVAGTPRIHRRKKSSPERQQEVDSRKESHDDTLFNEFFEKGSTIWELDSHLVDNVQYNGEKNS